MTKHIHVITSNPRLLQNTPTHLAVKGATAQINSKEGWQIVVKCRNQEQTEDLEMAQLEIYLPGGKQFTGTIQDIASLPALLKNAYDQLIKFSGQQFSNSFDESLALEATAEVNHFLTLFK